MKNNLVRLAAISLLLIVITFACKKDEDPVTTPPPNNNTPDTIPPIITLTGSTSMTISLNAAFTDPGASATDVHDGTLQVTTDASATNPNVNLKGDYTISYIATDAAGNADTVSRTVTVVNDAEYFAGFYNVSDSAAGTIFNYSQTITADNTVNNRIHFSLFGDYGNNTNIYATRLSNGNLSMPLQTAIDIGYNSGGQCDVATHTFQSTGYTSITNGFIIHYDDNLTSPLTCIGSAPGVATYTR